MRLRLAPPAVAARDRPRGPVGRAGFSAIRRRPVPPPTPAARQGRDVAADAGRDGRADAGGSEDDEPGRRLRSRRRRRPDTHRRGEAIRRHRSRHRVRRRSRGARAAQCGARRGRRQGDDRARATSSRKISRARRSSRSTCCRTSISSSGRGSLRCKPGTRVVSHAWDMGEWEPDAAFRVARERSVPVGRSGTGRGPLDAAGRSRILFRRGGAHAAFPARRRHAHAARQAAAAARRLRRGRVPGLHLRRSRRWRAQPARQGSTAPCCRGHCVSRETSPPSPDADGDRIASSARRRCRPRSRTGGR